MNLHDWIDELCDVLDVDAEVDEGLVGDLADAARRNVSPAAGPVTAFLLGWAAGASGAGPQELEVLAGRAQTLADEWDRPAMAPDPDEVAVEVEVPDDSAVDHSHDEFVG